MPQDSTSTPPESGTLLDPPEGIVSHGAVLHGVTVAPGMALGRIHRRDDELAASGTERVALDQVDQELNRFRRALDASRSQIQDLRGKLKGRVAEADARILDTHVTYLKDSVFIADVENLILNEQMRLESAIGKVVGDFDRIFRLVENETLRQSAVDLRDVGVRVLRNLEVEATGRVEKVEEDHILVAHELSIVDMFTLGNERVRGIVTRQGGLSSHAAIFARSMRIPTITGVETLFDDVNEGDFVILDATEGLLRVNPPTELREQYAENARVAAEEAARTAAGKWDGRAFTTADGTELSVEASCGNLPEVEQAAGLGMRAVGLYRTELLYLMDPDPPSLDALVHHYASVLAAVPGPVTFRLLNAESGLGIHYLHRTTERNPALGRVGMRGLFLNPDLLRRQLQALLLAGAERELRIVLPFVLDCADVARVRRYLTEERQFLRRGDRPFAEDVELGVVIETPAALFGLRDLAREADFLTVNLDALQQHLLAADREDPELARAFEPLHPFVLRALRSLLAEAEDEEVPLWIFGTSSRRPTNLEALLGLGLRNFLVPPAGLDAFAAAAVEVDLEQAMRAVEDRARHGSPDDGDPDVARFRHGYAPPPA